MPYRGPLDNVDTTNLLAAYSFHRVLISTYTGPLFRVREAGGDTEQDIGAVGGRVNLAALTSFCSGVNGFVTKVYDQSGNGNDLTQTTDANQPKAHDSSTGAMTIGGFLAPQWDGTNDSLFRSDALGMTGNPGLDFFCVHKANGAGSDRFVGLGGTANGAAINLANEVAIAGVSYRFGGGFIRFDTPGDEDEALSSYHARRASGDTYGDGLFWIHNAALTEESSGNPTLTPTLVDTEFAWGNGVQDTLQNSGQDGVELLVFGVASGNAVTAGDAATLRAEHVATFGG